MFTAQQEIFDLLNSNTKFTKKKKKLLVKLFKNNISNSKLNLYLFENIL